jgi:RNA 2',3'-cyclic 3'-phosphodiesterase
MRLFVGIPLADSVAGELSTVVQRLRSRENARGLRWSAPESWHITLQFLGNAAPEKLDCLIARLGEVRAAPVAIEIGQPRCFDRAGVFFADVEVSAGLANLQRRVLAATAECGFAAEEREFHPHVTLARKAGNKGPREQGSGEAGNRKTADKGTRGLGDVRPQSGTVGLTDLVAGVGTCRFSRFTAAEFLLYESHLGAGGSRYAVRMRVVLEEPTPQRFQEFNS